MGRYDFRITIHELRELISAGKTSPHEIDSEDRNRVLHGRLPPGLRMYRIRRRINSTKVSTLFLKIRLVS